jgi:hypothetical protein
MPPRSATATSTPRLSEFARRFSYPPGIAKTVWPRVVAKGAELGLGFDWWQSQLGTVCLGYGEDGKYVATVGGIGLSIPRQVGKTYFVLALLVIMCILFPGLQVVWTAHHLRTSTKTFTTLRGICRRRKVAPHIKAMRAANGEQQVEFANGSMIMFGARSMGFGRGFDEIDVEVFDEAQILDTKALEDMIAATNQARHPHGALLFFMGTPPRPSDPSEAFTSRRAEAWGGEAEDAIWLEIGADPKSDPNDRAQWPLMNPSYPKRTPLESMLRLRKNLKNEDSWNREGRGIWDDDDSGGAFSSGRWLDLKDPAAERGKGAVFGVHVTEDRDAWIAVAWWRDDGAAQVMLANDGQPVRAFVLVDECKRLASEWGGRVVPPRTFQDDLERAGVPLSPMKHGDFQIASGAFEDAFTAGTIRHGNQPALNTAVRVARMRAVGTAGEQVIQLKDAPEVGPLAAVVRALHGLQKRREVEPWAAYE